MVNLQQKCLKWKLSLQWHENYPYSDMKIILTVTLEVDNHNYFDHGNKSDINSGNDTGGGSDTDSDNVTDIDKVSHNDSNFDNDNWKWYDMSVKLHDKDTAARLTLTVMMEWQ